MALDPNIILHTQPTDFGISYDNMLKTGGDMVALQADKLKLQQMPQQFANQNALTGIQVRQAQQQEASQNALRGILSQPGAIDESGNPTPQAMQQVTAVDPNLAIKLKQNVLVQQENQAKLAYMKTTNFNEVNDQIYQRYEPLLDVYKKAIKDGVPPEQAQKAFQDGLTTANEDLHQGGFMTPEQFGRLPTKADPVQMENYVSGSKQHMERMKYEAAAQKEALAANRERFPDKPVEMQYTGPDNKPVSEQAVWDRDGKQWVSLNTHRPITAPDIHEVKERTLTDGDRDVRTIGDARIAAEEKATGAPLTDDRKAAIRQQARIDPKVAEATQKQDANAISDDAADLIAAETLKGDWHATVGMGRNQASMKKIAQARARLAKEQGITGADLAANTAEFAGLMAGERLLGTRGTAIGLGIAEAQQFGPMVLALSDKIKRTDYPTFNSLELAVAKGTGGEDVIRLVDSINAYKTAYAQVLSRGGVPTDDARRRSDEVLDKAWSAGQIRATIDQLGKEMTAAESAVPAVRNNLYRSVTGKDRPAQADSKPDSASPAGATQLAGNFYQGDKPPADHPDAKRNDADGRWYVQHDGNWYAVAKTEAAQSGTPAPTTPVTPTPAQANAPGRTRQNPVQVTTLEEAMKLPPATFFIGPDKKLRQRPMTTAAAAPSAATN
jgi:hypothetical protein